jgi:hypothetical protein
MAQYIGSAATFRTPGDATLVQNLMAIRNRAVSRSPVYLKRLTMQLDALSALTAVMPQVKVSRFGGKTSGGILLDNADFDTSATPLSTVQVRGAASADGVASTNPIRAESRAETGHWQQYAMRLHTTLGQVLAPDNSLLPILIENEDYVLYPGDSVIVQVMASVTSSNPTANHWFVQAVWEEPETFAISGTVTLDAVPVVGAKIIVVVADDLIATNAELWDVTESVSGGAWSSTVPVGKVGAAFVQHRVDPTLYTAPGSPFLQGP